MLSKKVYMNKIGFIIPVVLFGSCSRIGESGTWGIIALFGLILIIFSVMFYYIFKKKKQKDNRLVSFSASIREMLDRLETPEQKINTLNLLIERIQSDEKYAKTPDWKNSVLVKVYEHLGALYYKMDDTFNAIRIFGEVIELDPSQGMSYYNRGSIYSNMQNYKEALKDFNDAILLMPEYSNIYNNRGLVYYKTQKFDDALSDFDRAVDLQPTAVAYYNRGNTNYELLRFQEAKEDFFKSLELDPQNINGLKDDIYNSISMINNKLM